MKVWAHAALLVPLVVMCTQAVEGQTKASPNQPALRVVKGTPPSPSRLAVVTNGDELGSTPLPPDLTAEAIDAGLKRALWHPNGEDVALGFKGSKSSFVVVFLRQTTGRYLAADVSNVETVNIGFIGPFRTYKDRLTEPVEWLPLTRLQGSPFDGAEAVQIRLRTRVWDESGTRYSGIEPLIITRDGKPLWR